MQPQQEYASLVSKGDAHDSKHHLLAYGFTFALFCCMSPPMIVAVTMGMDEDARYWIGGSANWAIVLPFLLLAQHFYHLWMLDRVDRLRRYIFIVCSVVPPTLYLLVGGLYASMGRFYYGQLKAADCNSFHTKAVLQMAYDDAFQVWQGCQSRLLTENGLEPLWRQPILQQCDEWTVHQTESQGVGHWAPYRIHSVVVPERQNYARQWQYLADTERRHVCGGWCRPGPSLWTTLDVNGRQGGACTQYVAFKFLSISSNGALIFLCGIIQLIIAIPLYWLAVPWLNRLGYKSDISVL